jgi:hypothetical protein
MGKQRHVSRIRHGILINIILHHDLLEGVHIDPASSAPYADEIAFQFRRLNLEASLVDIRHNVI